MSKLKVLWRYLNTPLFCYSKKAKSLEVNQYLRSDFNFDNIVNKLTVSKYNEVYFLSELARLYFMFFEKEQAVTIISDRLNNETIIVCNYFDTYSKDKITEFYEYLPEGIFIFRNRRVNFQ